jgi:hypothetical protein
MARRWLANGRPSSRHLHRGGWSNGPPVAILNDSGKARLPSHSLTRP